VSVPVKPAGLHPAIQIQSNTVTGGTSKSCTQTPIRSLCRGEILRKLAVTLTASSFLKIALVLMHNQDKFHNN
jgi:hypothetical protein